MGDRITTFNDCPKCGTVGQFECYEALSSNMKVDYCEACGHTHNYIFKEKGSYVDIVPTYTCCDRTVIRGADTSAKDNSIDSELEEILVDLVWQLTDLTHEELIKDIKNNKVGEAAKAIKALYRKEVEEAIGEDEPLSNRCDNCGIKGCCGGDIPAVKNMFRAKLRAKLLPPTKGETK